MSKLFSSFKKSQSLDIMNPAASWWGRGYFDSTGKPAYHQIEGGKRGFTSRADRLAYDKREAAKGPNARTALSSQYA